MVFMTPLARTAIFPATVFTPCLNWAMSGPEGSTLSKPAAPAEDTHTHTHTHTSTFNPLITHTHTQRYTLIIFSTPTRTSHFTYTHIPKISPALSTSYIPTLKH